MKYFIEVIGNSSVGIDPEYHAVSLEWDLGPQDYDIEFYDDLEADFINLLKEKFDNGTIVNVLTEYEIGDPDDENY